MMIRAEAEEHVPATEWVRGTCVRCGSQDVLHHVLGMPLAESMQSSPSWVRWEGCAGLGPDRECRRCEYAWWSDDIGFAAAPAPLRVVGAVIVRETQILAARRRPGKGSGGLWEFPGGKIELGESPQQALFRELREELGVEVTVGRLIGRGQARAGDRDLHLDCYWARLDASGPVSSTDHDQLDWLHREHLADREWAEADVPILEEILGGAEPIFDLD